MVKTWLLLPLVSLAYFSCVHNHSLQPRSERSDPATKLREMAQNFVAENPVRENDPLLLKDIKGLIVKAASYSPEQWQDFLRSDMFHVHQSSFATLAAHEKPWLGLADTDTQNSNAKLEQKAMIALVSLAAVYTAAFASISLHWRKVNGYFCPLNKALLTSLGFSAATSIVLAVALGIEQPGPDFAAAAQVLGISGGVVAIIASGGLLWPVAATYGDGNFQEANDLLTVMDGFLTDAMKKKLARNEPFSPEDLKELRNHYISYLSEQYYERQDPWDIRGYKKARDELMDSFSPKLSDEEIKVLAQLIESWVMTMDGEKLADRLDRIEEVAETIKLQAVRSDDSAIKAYSRIRSYFGRYLETRPGRENFEGLYGDAFFNYFLMTANLGELGVPMSLLEGDNHSSADVTTLIRKRLLDFYFDYPRIPGLDKLTTGTQAYIPALVEKYNWRLEQLQIVKHHPAASILGVGGGIVAIVGASLLHPAGVEASLSTNSSANSLEKFLIGFGAQIDALLAKQS